MVSLARSSNCKMHRDIRKFSMQGEIGDDSALPRIRSDLERRVIQDMRDNGYIPVLDLGPYWSTEYDIMHDKYKFALSVYGVHVGRRKASEIEGMSDGKAMPRFIPQNKSKQSSETLE